LFGRGQRLAAQAGVWPLYRYNPALAKQGKNPLSIDSKAPKGSFQDYAYKETRYNMLAKAKPEVAALLMQEAKKNIQSRWRLLEQLAAMSYDGQDEEKTEKAE